jgi:osmotically-inducible protein OsmY
MTRRNFAAIALAAAATAALQGCFPMVAVGVGAGTLMVADRRTAGNYVEDENIEWKARQRVGERAGDRANVSVTSFNRNVLLTGEAPDAATRDEITRIVGNVPSVRAVTNEMQVGSPASLSSQGNDSYVTSKVKARFVEAGRFSPNYVKVITEAGTVYLLGLVTRAEADAATDIARTTEGVQKVVRVFEYISPEEAKRLDLRPPEPPAGTGGGGPR